MSRRPPAPLLLALPRALLLAVPRALLLALPRALLLAAFMAVAGVGATPARANAPPALTPSIVGEPPQGGGVFRFPQAVAFSPGGGTVFVGDQYSGVIQAFDPSGAYRFGFGMRASRRETGRIGVVGGVATDRDGHVYVLDSENDRVQIFDSSDGHFLTAFGDSSVFDLTSGTPQAGGGISASGIAVSQPQSGAPPVVYVADQGNDRVERFTLDPSTLQPAGPPALSPPTLGLDHPQGIALDPGATRVYVADDDNHRVVVLDPQSLAFVAQVGSFGAGLGQFENPYDVAVDAHQPSQLYVADNLNNRVDVFDASTLGYVGAFGGAGHTVGTFSVVRAVAALADDPRGGVDVADTANNRIQALDPSGALLAAWGIAGRGPGYVTRPRGVSFDPGGGVTVADTFDHRVERFDADGTYGGQFGLVNPATGFAAQGSGAGQFDSPAGVAYDSSGNLWVADTGNDRVVEIRPADGAVLFTTAGGTFTAPKDVAAGPAGSVYVADTGNGQVSQIGANDTITVIRSGLSRPSAVAYDGAADVYAADAAHVLDATTGVPVPPPPGEASWDHPAGLAIDPASGTLYVSEQRPATPAGARIVRGVPSGGGAYTWDTIATEGDGPAQVIEPGGLALSPDGGTLLVADAGNDRVLRFDAPGHAPPATQPLTVSLSDITRGTVTSDPAGIACATDCVQHYGAGRQVTLTATAFPGSQLAGWTGACAAAGTAATCTVTMAGAQTAGVTFAAAAPPVQTQPSPPPPPVRIASLRLSTRHLHLARPRDPRRHRHARPATRALVTVTLTRAARVTVTVEAGRPGRRQGSQCARLTRRHRRATCTRYVPLLGRRTLSLPAGASTFTLTPSLRGRPLKPGAYRLALVALDSDGNRVGPVTARFSVAR